MAMFDPRIVHSNGHPPSQRRRIHPAHEGERGGVFTGSFDEAMRCYLRDGGRTVAVIPIRFDDQGHPADVTWTPSHAERIDHLLFVFDGKSYRYNTGEIVCRAGQTLHLALRHLRLVDRFGIDLLKGR